jgi:serine/threonine protein kinase
MDTSMDADKKYKFLSSGVTGYIVATETSVIKVFNRQIVYDTSDYVLTKEERKLTCGKFTENDALFVFGDADNAKHIVDQINRLEKELLILRKLKNNKNIVQLCEDDFIEINDYYLGICMERMSSDLFEWLKVYPSKKISEDMVLLFTNQLLHGLKAIHDLGWVHFDFKPANILIQGDVLKITDFGNSVNFIPGGHDHITANYRPIELFRKKKYKTFDDLKKADVWSLGCVVYELLFIGTRFLPVKLTYTPEDVWVEMDKLEDIQNNINRILIRNMICDLRNRRSIDELIILFDMHFKNNMLFYNI